MPPRSCCGSKASNSPWWFMPPLRSCMSSRAAPSPLALKAKAPVSRKLANKALRRLRAAPVKRGHSSNCLILF
eukprot:3528502-Alexandrium_andersonii.AAC.1